MARGIALIVAAVLLGVVLLNQSEDPDPTAVATDGTTTTTEGDDAGEDTTTSSTTAPNAARNPAQVTVLVANGSRVNGAGARTAEKVKAGNYLAPTPVDAPTVASASVVHYLPGYELDAKAVAALLKPDLRVTAMPSPAPVPDLKGAQVLVVVAVDLARA